MEHQIAGEIHTIVRKYFRLLCLQGRSLEPYATQNEFLSLIKPTLTDTITLHLPCNGSKHVCVISKFVARDEIYVAYVGHLQRELAKVTRFYSYHCSRQHCDQNDRKKVERAMEKRKKKTRNFSWYGGRKNRDNGHGDEEKRDLVLTELVEANWVTQKIELKYADPFKEYLFVMFDKESGRFMEVFGEMSEEPISETTFEDVITLWIAVLIWIVQFLTTGAIHRQTSRITGKIGGVLIQ
ncbi:14424_t:CDS:2 [Ambispora leptoticha]|uniref:14424_t:CDS:1 n=1 Tax=Ambispora leptoticha TaxID=144679 RepID=A0A9N8ZKB6_9GLOM|nr:14424_t:CDS:2 [Ambispora leptoticha]